MERDSIDFKNTDIAALFRKLLLPTVLGMIFSALFVITDGIFVGKGIGSDALAAVNIVAPLWLFSTGIGLMFGVGASVVAPSTCHMKVKTSPHQYYSVYSCIFIVVDRYLHAILFIRPTGSTSFGRFRAFDSTGCRVYGMVCSVLGIYRPA